MALSTGGDDLKGKDFDNSRPVTRNRIKALRYFNTNFCSHSAFSSMLKEKAFFVPVKILVILRLL